MNEQIIARIRRVVVLLLVIAGLISWGISFGAANLGFNFTPGFGAWQMFFFMIGLTCFTVAGFLYLQGLRRADSTRSLQADIGIRLAATGLVFAYVAGFADLLGIGRHPHANYPRPFVGWLQISGIFLGLFVIVAGMLLYHTSRGRRKSSSLEFLIRNQNGETPPQEEPTELEPAQPVVGEASAGQNPS